MALDGRTASTLAASIERAIHGGELGPEDPLPTVRALADELGISPSTVAAAYRRLRDRGFLVAAGRRGTRVAPAAPSHRLRPPRPLPEGVADLSTGRPDPALLPPLAPAFAALADLPHAAGGETDDASLIAFARAEFEADQVPARALVVVGGGLDGIERVLREETRPGDTVAVEDPGFPALLDLVAAMGLRVEPFGLDDDGPRPEALDAALSAARVAVVTPRAQNPTGAVLTAARAAELGRVLARHPDVLVIEDDYAGPVSGAPLVTLCNRRKRWAVVRSVTKWLGADLRLAFVAGDELTVSRVGGRLALGTRSVSRILQRAVLAVWSDPSSGRRLARAADAYARRRTALLTALDRHGVAARGRSGFGVWVPVRDEAAVVTRLEARGWMVAPGARFRLRTGPAVRVTTAALEPSDARRLAAELAGALDGVDPGAA